MRRMLIDRSTLDLITSDARDYLDALDAAGLFNASALMRGVLEQLALDREQLPNHTGEVGPDYG